MRHSNRFRFLLALMVSVVATAGPLKATRLDRTKRFPVRYQKGALAVLQAVQSRGAKPENYYAEIKPQGDGSLVFNLWSSDSYHRIKANRPIDPGGGIVVTVNPSTGAILEIIFEQ